eukprot:764752-Hanusia_phi.AAC.2
MPPSRSNADIPFVHLTNYSINKRRDNFTCDSYGFSGFKVMRKVGGWESEILTCHNSEPSLPSVNGCENTDTTHRRSGKRFRSEKTTDAAAERDGDAEGSSEPEQTQEVEEQKQQERDKEEEERVEEEAQRE